MDVVVVVVESKLENKAVKHALAIRVGARY
jgi:hypothetical protein